MAVLEILATAGRVNGRALAARLGVTQRTIRRDILALERMGVPVTADRGGDGGYGLVAGYRLPPLLFTPDEALAIGLGLSAVRGLDLLADRTAIAGAAAKLERVMPTTVRSRLRAMQSAVTFGRGRRTHHATASALSALASCAHDGRGARLRYRSAAQRDSERDFDPYGVAFLRGVWYVVGFCHLRQDVRTLRLDRVEGVESQVRTFVRPADFSILDHLATSFALLPRAHAVSVLLRTDLASATRQLIPELGVLQPEADGIRLRSQVDDLEWCARELARLPWPFEIEAPEALREAFDRHLVMLEHGRRPGRLSAGA